jgi:pimeloyl-ACP methyl ester carboxylesterase
MSSRGRAETWRERGSYVTWQPREGGAPPVDVFHVESGDPAAPVVLLVHGFPTCSVDWFDVVPLLREEYRVCALDFPGYGFSAKPLGWGYSLARDAELLDHYLHDVLGVPSAVVLAHDRGSSVALNFALAESRRTRIDHLVLSNANIFLPLSNLTDFQRRTLDPSSWPGLRDALTPAALAAGMGTATFFPPRAADEPDVEALAATFAHADGIAVLHETIQYLRERAAHEREWLEALAGLDLPTTVVWGMNDTVSPPRVATHVWSEFVMRKPGRNRLYLIPDAGHYLQVDRPDAMVAVLRHTLDPASSAVAQALVAEAASPLLVDESRPRLGTGADVLRSPAG